MEEKSLTQQMKDGELFICDVRLRFRDVILNESPIKKKRKPYKNRKRKLTRV